MPYDEKIEPLITTHEPFGCHCQAISSVGGCFNFPAGAKAFDDLLKRNHGRGDGYKGQYFTGTLVSIYEDKKTEAELIKRGFKLLGIQAGAHGTYRMMLYGLGFKLPNEKKEE